MNHFGKVTVKVLPCPKRLGVQGHPTVSLPQQKQTALAVTVEFREADGIGPDDALDLRGGTVAGLQQDNLVAAGPM